MREENLKFYIIALVRTAPGIVYPIPYQICIDWTTQEREANSCISFINLQGKLDCTYVVGYFFSPKPQRAHLRERWPSSDDENLERLEDAGLPYDRQVPKCGNCGGKLTHTIMGQPLTCSRNGPYCPWLHAGTSRD